MTEKKKVSVTIAGLQYDLHVTDEEPLQRAVAIVEERMEQIRESSRTINPVKTAVVAALQSVLEYLELKERCDDNQSLVVNTARSLIESLEDRLLDEAEEGGGKRLWIDEVSEGGEPEDFGDRDDNYDEQPFTL
ncbi:cell division protein ZapA [bacterium]|nr:cell division protein ZapA [bacterium]